MARSVAALSDEDHVGMVRRAMVEAHGEVAGEQFTGHYERQHWEVDEHQAGGLAGPACLYPLTTPPRTTPCSSASTRVSRTGGSSQRGSRPCGGTTQLLLELGLVDEAKQVVDAWMSRWITT